VHGIAVGRDCNLYISIQGVLAGAVVVYNGVTDVLMGTLVPADLTRNGGVTTGGPVTFGDDGSLYVTNSSPPFVVRYNGTTGQVLRVFPLIDLPAGWITFRNGILYVGTVAPAPGVQGINVQTGTVSRFVDSPLGYPIAGVTFDANGFFYMVRTVLGQPNLSDILRFTNTGPPGIFVAQGTSGGLGEAADLAFGPNDGNLYVLAFAGNKVMRYSGKDGSFISSFAAIPGPGGGPYYLAFSPSTCR
jgi:outer membrane protein assembly factor BamB